MASILITGSNRGLGLEWAQQYAHEGWRVFATCRHPDEAAALQRLAQAHPNATLHRLDVTDTEQLRALAQELRHESIDILLNNAGVYFEKFEQDHLGAINYRDWEESFRVNTLGAVRVTEAFTPHLSHGDKRLVVAITSHMGSITEITVAGSYAYRSSKAALNAVMRGFSQELLPLGIGILLLHPGWVQTRMGGPGALLSTEQSVSAMRHLVETYHPRHNGRFFRYDGTEIPW